MKKNMTIRQIKENKMATYKKEQRGTKTETEE